MVVVLLGANFVFIRRPHTGWGRECQGILRLMLPLIYHPSYAIGITRAGKTRETKYARLRARLEAYQGQVVFYSPKAAGEADLYRVHDAVYVDAVKNLTLSDAALRRIGFSRVPEIYSRPARSCGGSFLAGVVALERGVAFNLAGGSHHAHRDFGSGYCVFNDVGVAAARLLDENRAARITILDLDVHQGDGTATLFQADPRVTTISVHAGRNFPARKARSDYDIALANGTGDTDYIQAVRQALAAISKAPKPDLIFYNAGVDIMVTDRLGYLAVSPQGLKAREETVFSFAHQNQIPIALVLGGGYDADQDRLTGHHHVAVETALTLFAG